jgi:acetyltransferase-like isoleucine patch superfamily enzyme
VSHDSPADTGRGSPGDPDRTAKDTGNDAPDGRRHDRLHRHPTPGQRNSLRGWTDAKPVWRVVLNYLMVWVVRIAPSLRVRSWMLRRLGAAVGDGVSWGLEATPDVFWPELITLGDDVVVGYDSVLLCHEFLQDEYRTGEVVIGDRAMIGAKAVILPGVRIGPDAEVAANSLVTRDVPSGATVAGVPARPMGGGSSGSGGAGDGGDDGSNSSDGCDPDTDRADADDR